MQGEEKGKVATEAELGAAGPTPRNPAASGGWEGPEQTALGPPEETSPARTLTSAQAG